MTLIIKDERKHDVDFTVKQLQTIVKDLITVNNYANKAKLVDEVVTKIQMFIGIGGLEDEKQKYLEQELVNLSTYLLFNQILFYRIYRIRVENNDLSPLKNIKNKGELQTLFGKIENKGYRAIYRVNVLQHISDRPEVIETINDVIEAVKSLRPEQITHDIAGIFFHKLIPFDIRKVLATYYTVPNAADLLAGLSVQSSDETIFDPACGSGTLLVASYKRKEIFWQKYVGGYTSEKMHQQFLEEDITGNDIMPFAGHLTTMNLAMQNIEQSTKRVRIASSDSLDLATNFIDTNFIKGKGHHVSKFQTHQQATLDDGTNAKKAKGTTISTSGALSLDGTGSGFKLTPWDLVIMNPPFSDIEKIAKSRHAD